MKSRVAVVGCGHWGKNLVRNLHELGALTHVCDAEQSSTQSIQQLYPGLTVSEDYDQMLAAGGIDAVVIATPAEQHARTAEAALLAGKDVFVEKPLALRYHDGERLVEIAEKLEKILMVGHLLEYHPAILKLQELIDIGELGKIQYIYSNRLNLGRVRREENILWSFAPHDVAVILRLVGELPLEVLRRVELICNPTSPMSRLLISTLTTASGPTFSSAGFILIRNIGSSLSAQRRWLALTISLIRISSSFMIKASNGSMASP